MDHQQFRLAKSHLTLLTEVETELHRVAFLVMQAAERGERLEVLLAKSEQLLKTLTVQDALTVPVRFATMRYLFVVGCSIDRRDASLRDPFLKLLELQSLQTPVPASDDPMKLSSRNNHLLMQAAMLCVWPEVKGADKTIAELVERYLTDRLPNGLFPAELSRGASALWYSNLAVMLLTAIEWHRKGSIEGTCLQTAVSGFETLLEDPSPWYSFMRRNLYSHPDHPTDPLQLDRSFLHGYRRSRHYLAWVPLMQELIGAEKVSISVPSDDFFPLCSDFIGGFTDKFLRSRPE